MFRIPLFTIVAAIAALLAYAAQQPDRFLVERGISIQAPPEKVYAILSDFRHWESWSPWEKVDPAMKRTFSGAPSGTGAVYAWEGDNKVGSGRMEIVNTSPPNLIVIKLDFLKPLESHNIAEFTLRSDGGATYVSWVMHGPSSYIAKLIGVFRSMDKMVGEDFRKGLEQLKAVAESS